MSNYVENFSNFILPNSKLYRFSIKNPKTLIKYMIKNMVVKCKIIFIDEFSKYYVILSYNI